MTWILPKQLHTLASALDMEALSLDSNEQSQICAQSLFVRSKPSQLRIWSAKWKRDSWTRHLFGRILRPSLGQRFATEWTSSLEATHASHSVQPGSAEARTTQGTCGPTSQTAFDFSNPGSVSLKTSKDISAWGCPTSSKTWQEWVIERRGAYSVRLKSAHRISASGCSSWPSPVASEVRQGFQDRSRGMKGSQESLTTVVVKSWPTPNCMDVITPNRDLMQMESKGHWGKGMNTGKLSEMVKSWPTPNAADPRQGGATQGARKSPNLSIAIYGPPVPASSSTDGSRPGLSWPTPQTMDVLPVRPVETFAESNRTRGGRKNRQALSNLREAIHSPVYQVKQWQTATVSTGAHRQKDGSMTDKLDQQVKNWATARSGMARGNKFTYDRGKGNIEEQAGASVQGGGKLNPRWVETLMGLPVGWTMPSCASPVTIERTSSDCSVTVLSQQQQNEPLER